MLYLATNDNNRQLASRLAQNVVPYRKCVGAEPIPRDLKTAKDFIEIAAPLGKFLFVGIRYQVFKAILLSKLWLPAYAPDFFFRFLALAFAVLILAAAFDALTAIGPLPDLKPPKHFIDFEGPRSQNVFVRKAPQSIHSE